MRARGALLALTLIAALAACTDNGSSGGGSSAAPSASGSTTAGGLTASPTPSVAPIVGECPSVLPVRAVDQALGQPIVGGTSFIVGTPEPDIDRVSYLNCQYGIAAAVPGQPAPVPQVEVGISAYGSPASAQSRVQGTVEAYREQGASQASVPVGALTGTVLVGSGEPTLVVASGNKTVAVTVVAPLVPDATRNAILSAIAQRALTGAGG